MSFFFCGEFPPFCKHKRAINNNKKFYLILNFLRFYFSNDIILQWVLRFVAKIYEYLNKFVSLLWIMTNTWLNFIMDDPED